MRGWPLLLAAACGAPRTVTPAPAPPPFAPSDARIDAVVVDAPPPRAARSPDFGPSIDKVQHVDLQDHEVTIALADQRIVMGDADPTHAAVEVIGGFTGRAIGPDGTWAVERDPKTDAIITGALAGDALVHPVRLDRFSLTRIRFAGGSELQRTVVLDRAQYGWFLMRSSDGGATWKKTLLWPVEPSIETSSRSVDVLVRDPSKARRDAGQLRWVRVDRTGDVTTTVIRDVGAPVDACAAALLWIEERDRMHWFDHDTDGAVAASPLGWLACAGDAVLVQVSGGISRCTRAGCSAAEPPGSFADLTSDGIATATVSGGAVRVVRTDRAPVEFELDDGDRVLAMAVWNDTPTLVVAGASGRLHFAWAP